MMTNKDGLDLIKSFEGLELKAYKDPVGIWTIGYGHTAAAGNPVPKAGMTVTEKEATDLLAKDLIAYENMVKRNVKASLTDNQFAALVSFTYNLGEGNLKSSTLLKKVNAKDFTGAAKEFSKWNKAGGKVLAGLTRRRAAEAALFSKTSVKAPNSPVESVPVVPTVVVPPKVTTPVDKPYEPFWKTLLNIGLWFLGGRK